MTRWTSVVSYHIDPETCGVARFSKQLADRLGVPLVGATEPVSCWGRDPLLSIKFTEWRADGAMASCDQLWHDEPPRKWAPVAGARVWKLYELGVPALVETPHMADRALFTFGMAHKQTDLERWRAVQLFYPMQQLWISSAVHEGAGPSTVPDLMRLWGPEKARNLGHLSDAALQLVWPRVRAFVAFFEHGLRANNSSVHAALNAGVPVITNWGDQTPTDLRSRTTDYRTLGSSYLLTSTDSPYTWDRLLKELMCGSSI